MQLTGVWPAPTMPTTFRPAAFSPASHSWRAKMRSRSRNMTCRAVQHVPWKRNRSFVDAYDHQSRLSQAHQDLLARKHLYLQR